MTKRKGETSRSKPAALTSSLLARKGAATTTGVARFPEDDKPVMVRAADAGPTQEDSAWTEELIFSTQDRGDDAERQRPLAEDRDEEDGPIIDEEIVRQVLGSDPLTPPRREIRDEAETPEADPFAATEDGDEPSSIYARAEPEPDLLSDGDANDHREGFSVPQGPDPFVVFTPEFEALERRSSARRLVAPLSLVLAAVIGVTVLLVYAWSGDEDAVPPTQVAVAIADQPSVTGSKAPTASLPRTAIEVTPAAPAPPSNRPAAAAVPDRMPAARPAETAIPPAVSPTQPPPRTSFPAAGASPREFAARSGLPSVPEQGSGPGATAPQAGTSSATAGATDKPQATIVVGEPGAKLVTETGAVVRSPAPVGKEAPPTAVTGQKAPAVAVVPAGEPASLAAAKDDGAGSQIAAQPSPIESESKAKPAPAGSGKTDAAAGGHKPAGDAADRPTVEARLTTPAPPKGAGAYAIQLLSLRSEGAARRAWERLRTAHPGLLAERMLEVEKAQIKGRGTFYRVQTGGFESRGEANGVCSQLKSRKQDCLVVRR